MSGRRWFLAGSDRGRRRRAALLTAAVVLGALLPTVGRNEASAAYPGRDGLIAFMESTGRGCSSSTLRTIRPDGTGVHVLTDAVAAPSWSPDSSRIAFDDGSGISIINADGTGLRFLGPGVSPTWSPDGAWIAYVAPLQDRFGPIFKRLVAGGNPVQVSTVDRDPNHPYATGPRSDGGRWEATAGGDIDPAWSPAGDRIVFERGANIAFISPSGTRSQGPGHNDLYSIGPDGTGLTQLMGDNASADPNTGLNDRPSWSPDASMIAFRHDYSNAGDNQIATLPAAGGVPTVITAFPAPQSYVQPALSYSPTGRLAYSTGTPGAAFASNDIYVDGRSVYTAPNGICGLSWGSFLGTRVDAAFTSAPSGGQGGFQFTSTSTSSDGSPLTERWDFGDGASGAGRTVTHTYARPGTYTVTLTSTNTAGTSGTGTGTVTVAPSTLNVFVQPTITPGGLRVGAGVDVPVTVTAGPYDLHDVTVGPLTASSDAATVGPAPAGTAGMTLAARESRTFHWKVTGAKAGRVTLADSATGTDGQGGTVTGRDQTTFPVVPAGTLTVKVDFEQHGAPLPGNTVTLADGDTGDVPQDLMAVVTVTNPGPTTQTRLSFQGVPPLSFHDPADARLPFPAAVTAGPLPAGALPDLAAGASLTRTYRVHLTGEGVLDLSPQVTSTDDGSDTPQVSQGVGTLTVLTSALKVDWRMPSRVAASVKDLSHAGTTRGLPKPSFVSPTSWKVSLLLRHGSAAPADCPAGVTYTWQVTAPAGGKVIVKPRPGCSTTMTVSRLGTYKATATRMVQTATGTKAAGKPILGKIKVEDLLVVGLGDSNASGEGAGNFYYPNCNRGEASYQYQAALALEHKLKGHASITFVSPACSGARSQHLVDTTYDGIDGDTLLAPQITSLRALLSQHKGSPARTVSTARMSIGINNIGFGPLLAYCLMNPPALRGTSCDQQEVVRHDDGTGGVSNWSLAPPGGETLDRQVLRLVRQLRDRYSEVAASLHGLVSPRHVYLSQYPTEVYGDHGSLCGATNSVFPTAVWSWLHDTGDALNAAVDAGAHAHGWHTLVVPDKAYVGHGYCAHDSWFVNLTTALKNEVDSFTSGVYVGTHAGAFHATARGAKVTADIAVADICPALAPDKRDCRR